VETAKPEESFIRDHLIEQQSHHLAAQFQSLFHPPLLLLSRPSQICAWRGAARRRSGHCRWSATYRPTRSAVSIANTATTLPVCFRGSIADCASASCSSTAPIAQLKVVATRSSRVTPGSTRVLARHDRVRGPGGRRRPAGGLQELLKGRDLFPFGNDQQRKDAPLTVMRQAREMKNKCLYAKLKPCFVIGNVRMRSPVAVKIALLTAGKIGGKAGSPNPVGGLLDFRKWTSMGGACDIFNIGC
jgi:hypothetical protein